VIAVAKLRRNEPCPCGSGRKVKRCCGQQRGPLPEALAWQCLHEQARKFAPILRGYDELEIDQLLENVIQLPVHHLGLQVPLPRIFPPELEWLRADIENGTDDLVDSVQDAAAAIDGPHLRLTLAAAAAQLCHDDKIDLEDLAVIIVDLARPTSLFVSASLIAATAVNLGRRPTPAGLHVAAS
jgi:SEC-C motif